MPYNRMHMRRVLCSMAVYLLLSGSSAPASTQTSSAAQQFAHGYARWSAGRHAEAKEFFVQALAPDSPLADYALYFLSRIAIQEREWETARQLLAGLQSRYPQSVWFPHAEIQRAKIAIGERDYPQAVDILRSLRERKELPEQIAEESLFLEAQAHEARGDLAQAFSLYLEVRNRAPSLPGRRSRGKKPAV
ncbi:MAG TPA: tetratricopeptide repeat protein [Candidatus Eisenbacteria bacterium]|nr:tetratricopeptide repeat protein [Candidatus Eisenbacteria bacterium]